MENVVCLGSVACRIGEKLETYKKYKILYIDDEPPKLKKKKGSFVLLKGRSSPDEYESHYDESNNSALSHIKGKCVFIVCGASIVSGAALRILEQISLTTSRNIEVLYIRPEITLLSETKKLQERVVYNVFQQYARSGVFCRLLLVSNESVSKLIGEVPLLQYFDKVNELISSTFHMVNVFDNSRAVVDTFSTLRPSSRIATLSVFTPGAPSESAFFDMLDLTEAKFYYGIPSQALKDEPGLYREVLAEMKKRVEIYSKVSYGIYETSYDTKIGYGVLYSNQIQEENNN